MSKKTNDVWDITERMMQGKFTDAKFGEWSKPFPGPDQTQVRFYREVRNGKVVGIKEIKSETGGLRKLVIPLEEVEWHLKDTKDAEGSEVKNGSGVVKCKKCGSQLWNLRSGEYYCTKCGAKMDAPLSKDAKSESEWDLKFRLRHALPGETMSNKLGTVRGILAREGFDRNFKSYGDRVFSATHSRMGFTVNIETEPTDDSRNVLKIRQVWFSDSKPTKDAPADPKLLSNKEIYAELKTHPDKRREQVLMNELKRRATLARRDYEGLANYMNGDAMMNGANYRPSLDAVAAKDAEEPWVVFTLNGKELVSYTVRGTFPGELQATKESLAYENGVDVSQIKHKIVVRKHTKDAAADGRETWKWDTMFMDLAEKVYNKLQMAGITSNVRKNGQYYHIEAKVTPDERKKIEFFIKGHTIHSVGGYRSMDYPGK